MAGHTVRDPSPSPKGRDNIPTPASSPTLSVASFQYEPQRRFDITRLRECYMQRGLAPGGCEG